MGQGKESRVALDQLGAIDKKRIVKLGEFINTKEHMTIKQIVKGMLVDQK